MNLRAVVCLLSFALWFYYGVIRNDNPIRPESFSVLSMGMPPKRNVTTVPSSSMTCIFLSFYST